MERKAQIEKILNAQVSNEEFALMIASGKAVTDFNPQKEEYGGAGEMDEDVGVTVLLDDDEDDQEDDDDLDEVLDDDDPDDL
jgi:pre-mRNA-splicing helicase BRR2